MNFWQIIKTKVGLLNIPTILAEEDADTEVVGRIDVSKIQSGRPIVVFGQGTDLFVLLSGLPQCKNVQLFFHKPYGTPSSYDISKIREEIGDMKYVILFLRAITVILRLLYLAKAKLTRTNCKVCQMIPAQQLYSFMKIGQTKIFLERYERLLS